jgi:hypothetical protein
MRMFWPLPLLLLGAVPWPWSGDQGEVGQCLVSNGTAAPSWEACAEAAGTYSGVGACGANQWASTLNEGAAPTCTQPAFSNLSGSVAAAQLPSPGATTKGGVEAETCSGNDKVSAINTDGTVTCSADQTGGGGVPTDADYVTATSNASLSAERVLTAGTNTAIDTSVVGQIKVNLSGTHADSFHTDAYSGVGACGANTWASTLSDNAAPTCTQPGFSNLSGSATDAQIPNTITVDLAAAATALAANPTDCSAGQYATTIAASGALTCAQPAFSEVSGSVTDAQVPNTITLDNLTQITTRAISDTTGILAGSRGGVGVALPTCSGTDKLTANGTQVSCAADQTGGAGSWPTGKLTSPVAVAVNASYVTVFTVTPGTSKQNQLEFRIMHAASATTVGVQFRVSSADAGNVGNCFFATHGVAGTAASATAEEYDVIAIGAAPADTGAAAAGFTALNVVDILCNFASDGTPGNVLLEAQLETGTVSINVLAGSYYNLVTN